MQIWSWMCINKWINGDGKWGTWSMRSLPTHLSMHIEGGKDFWKLRMNYWAIATWSVLGGGRLCTNGTELLIDRLDGLNLIRIVVYTNLFGSLMQEIPIKCKQMVKSVYYRKFLYCYEIVTATIVHTKINLPETKRNITMTQI